MKYNDVYFDDTNQKIRWTQTTPENLPVTYDYVGKTTRVEFDLLIELLWQRYEDSIIDLKDLKKIFNDLRVFCDSIKNNYNL
tara:strand:- start:455 stop:700 length:246 start_codon:yes stop_codon:yes gene_type:complete